MSEQPAEVACSLLAALVLSFQECAARAASQGVLIQEDFTAGQGERGSVLLQPEEFLNSNSINSSR